MTHQQTQSTKEIDKHKQTQNHCQTQTQNLNIDEIQKILDSMNFEESSSNISPNAQTQEDSQTDEHQNSCNRPDEEQLIERSNEIDLKDVEVSKSQVTFGTSSPLFPGAIEEIDFSINLNFTQTQQNQEIETDETSYVLRVKAICLNQEFQNLDEYVFSVRSNNYFQYYEQVRFKIKRGERADVKVAVKVPPVHTNYSINGVLEIRLGNLEAIVVPIIVKYVIPDIVCLKTLFKEDEETAIIRVPAKKGQQRTAPIPFKNTNPFPLFLQIDTVSCENYAEKPYDIITQNYASCQANSQFFINMQLKQNFNYIGDTPSRMTIRKVLVLKIKNSSSFFHFPLEVSIFESQAFEGN